MEIDLDKTIELFRMALSEEITEDEYNEKIAEILSAILYDDVS